MCMMMQWCHLLREQTTSQLLITYVDADNMPKKTIQCRGFGAVFYHILLMSNKMKLWRLNFSWETLSSTLNAFVGNKNCRASDLHFETNWMIVLRVLVYFIDGIVCSWQVHVLLFYSLRSHYFWFRIALMINYYVCILQTIYYCQEHPHSAKSTDACILELPSNVVLLLSSVLTSWFSYQPNLIHSLIRYCVFLI